MDLRNIEKKIVVSTRFFCLVAVFGSMISSILMFTLGLYNVYQAFLNVFEETERIFGASAVIGVIEALDRFLIAIVLLYFGYGVYALFIHPEESEEELALPAWLRVRQIGQLKQVVAELIVIVLFVLFLRKSLEMFSGPAAALTWAEIATLGILPVSTVLLGLTLRLIELHPKSRGTGSERSRSDGS